MPSTGPHPDPHHLVPLPRYEVRSLCSEHPKRDELWFSPGRTLAEIARAKEAARLCQVCPCRDACQAYSEIVQPVAGVWGPGVLWVRSGRGDSIGQPAVIDLLAE
jgi:hypothetical protein